MFPCKMMYFNTSITCFWGNYFPYLDFFQKIYFLNANITICTVIMAIKNRYITVTVQ